MKLKRLQHAMYLCRDLEASRKFYTDVLGMEEIPRKLIDPVRKGAWFKLGDTRFHLAQWEEGHWRLVSRHLTGRERAPRLQSKASRTIRGCRNALGLRLGSAAQYVDLAMASTEV